MNEHWKVIANGGIVISTTPEQFWEQACAYFKWSDEHPISAKKTLQSGKEAGRKVDVEYRRPYTVDALCLHCGITKAWIMDLSSMHGKDSKWYMVAQKIITIISTQNIEGALVDQFNPIVVSKLLNLDKPQDEDVRTVRVEIVDSFQTKLANSEAEIVANLDFDMVEKFEKKLADDKEHSA